MISALYGSLITIIVSTGLSVAVNLIESSYSNSVRYPLTNEERLIFSRANLDEFIDIMNQEIKTLDQRL
tara:strand:+ start:454 stop:660 length:207 start_codon:yes stop_codon:yes gene_type:complete